MSSYRERFKQFRNKVSEVPGLSFLGDKEDRKVRRQGKKWEPIVRRHTRNRRPPWHLTKAA